METREGSADLKCSVVTLELCAQPRPREAADSVPGDVRPVVGQWCEGGSGPLRVGASVCFHKRSRVFSGVRGEAEEI